MVSNATYRFEQAKTGRAICRNTACKKAGLKIQKGELRMGTLVTILENTSWHWKHWGCVTPLQIANLQGQLEGLDTDDDRDMELIDGWEDLTPESRDLIRKAVYFGHVDDDVWKGDPEFNRPGMKGINRRTPKKSPTAEPEPGEAESPIKKEAAARKQSKRKLSVADNEGEVKPQPKKAKKAIKAEVDSDAEVKPKPKKGKKAIKAEDDSDAEVKPKKGKKAIKREDEDVEVDVKPKKATKSRAKKAQPVPDLADSDDAATSELEKPAPKAKKGKKTKVKEETEDVADVIDVAPVPAKKGRKVKAVKVEAVEEKPVVAKRTSARRAKA